VVVVHKLVLLLQGLRSQGKTQVHFLMVLLEQVVHTFEVEDLPNNQSQVRLQGTGLLEQILLEQGLLQSRGMIQKFLLLLLLLLEQVSLEKVVHTSAAQLLR
jgi:hypothetical protein